VDLVLRHEARADQVADEVGEPLPLTPQIRSGQGVLSGEATHAPVFCIWMLGCIQYGREHRTLDS